MKAAVVRQFKSPLRIEDVPKPTPGPGEVVLKIEASGLCDTDIHAAHGDWPVKPKLPLIMIDVADYVVNPIREDPVEAIRKLGGADQAICLAVSPKASTRRIARCDGAERSPSSRSRRRTSCSFRSSRPS
jgi:hypothetical protein